ncbi:uncharacterized protein LOC117583433 [Drosophila guanche]|uniref:Chitin-binding type-2 domain-containing protein n=1 Tax=Drosophila guanche TaxID=7266 RepID=A0A3B0K652_DROGU|nr:uncharacterized protein LOC117583433 [Drosophila guanche]SPP81096.1 Hypothetical predicted protein [Drosophila guanche]
MNFLHLFALLFVLCLGSRCCSGASVGKPTGQPGCQTEQEIAVATYPHFYLKSSYWICSTQGVPATLAACPIPSAWLDSAKSCVPWSEWYWTPTALPPSEPLPTA